MDKGDSIHSTFSHLTSKLDGATIMAGGLVAFLNEHLPLAISLVTLLLLVVRLAIALKEYRRK